jgi:hypothetical protein
MTTVTSMARRTFISYENDDVEAPADQAPIQLETLSPVASHALFCLCFRWFI